MKAKSKPKGRLIALDGPGGSSMAMAARIIERNLRREKIAVASSGWDASDIFFQIAQGARGLPAPPPQTLILLYATDLAFRLRWQIRPALEQGTTVIAGPYVETAIGLGRGAGLPYSWLRTLFEFAPRPDESYCVPQTTTRVDRRGTPADSFLEFCLAQLRIGPGSWDTEEIRRGLFAHLARLEARGRCRTATPLSSKVKAPARGSMARPVAP